MRDPQKERVYLTETQFTRDVDLRLLDQKDCQDFISEVMTYASWRRVVLSQRPVIVQFHPDVSRAQANGDVIQLAPDARNYAGVLHEMAHIAMMRSRQGRVQDHGPEFVGVLLWLWYEFDPVYAGRWERLSLDNEVAARPIKGFATLVDM